MGTTIKFSINKDESHYIQVQIDLEDYLIDGRTQWDKDEDICYFPIFLVDPGEAMDAFSTWFLGNMFMDRYMIIHNMEGANDIGGRYYPRIGILDKYAENEANVEFMQ